MDCSPVGWATPSTPRFIWSTRWRTSVLHVKNTWRKSRGRMRTILRTILQRAIRKNAATRDATDEAVQNQVTRYLKGAADRAGGRRRRGGPRDLP
ncbi:hypothetical protein UPYG_G00355240 [Umbra pygmaea]|uniref:Uncharacterized protein n=1 Tax=Umbra pygmaea TaxID=75934 RepID=A0ABD0WB46_UMBPY